MAPKAWKCLIVDDMHPDLLPALAKGGIIADYQPRIDPDQIGPALPGYQVLVVRSKVRINRELLLQAPDLRLVARAGAGIDNIDEEALRERGIDLVNAPEGNRDAVGEHTLGMLLCLLNKLHTADRQVREKVWKREANRGTELGGKTVAIIGYGNMGQSFARRLAGFGCRVLAYDKYHSLKNSPYALGATMEQVRSEADVVSLHVPLTPETHQMVDYDWIGSFSKHIYLLNTSRGEVTRQQALVQHLKEGKLLGLALDVLENEKLLQLTPEQEENFAYLAAQDNVLLSPHVAGWSHESYARISTVLGAKITEYYSTAV